MAARGVWAYTADLHSTGHWASQGHRQVTKSGDDLIAWDLGGSEPGLKDGLGLGFWRKRRFQASVRMPQCRVCFLRRL